MAALASKPGRPALGTMGSAAAETEAIECGRRRNGTEAPVAVVARSRLDANAVRLAEAASASARQNAVRSTSSAVLTALVLDTRVGEPALSYPVRGARGASLRQGAEKYQARDAGPPERKSSAAAPIISLSHSQALWVLREIWLSHGSSQTKFAYYVKHLRKIDIPFGWNHQPTRGKSVTYDFYSMMELAIALALRVYGTLPDSITDALRNHRERLQAIYSEAGLGKKSTLWTSARIAGSSGAMVSGVYLELGVALKNGRYVQAGQPTALSAREAIERFAVSHPADRSWLPLNISRLAADLVVAAERAPPVRSGPNKARTSAVRRLGLRE